MYHAIIITERKQTQKLDLHHNWFVEMFVFSSDASHLWGKKEMVGILIQYVSGNILSSLVGLFEVYDFIFWGMRQSIYFLVFIAESCQCVFYYLKKKCNYYRKWRHIYQSQTDHWLIIDWSTTIFTTYPSLLNYWLCHCHYSFYLMHKEQVRNKWGEVFSLNLKN